MADPKTTVTIPASPGYFVALPFRSKEGGGFDRVRTHVVVAWSHESTGTWPIVLGTPKLIDALRKSGTPDDIIIGIPSVGEQRFQWRGKIWPSLNLFRELNADAPAGAPAPGGIRMSGGRS